MSGTADVSAADLEMAQMGVLMHRTNGTVDEGAIVPHRLLTLPEAARYLGCALWAMRELIWKGMLPYTRFGKRFQVDVQDLDELVEREKRCEGSEARVTRVHPARGRLSHPRPQREQATLV